MQSAAYFVVLPWIRRTLKRAIVLRVANKRIGSRPVKIDQGKKEFVKESQSLVSELCASTQSAMFLLLKRVANCSAVNNALLTHLGATDLLTALVTDVPSTSSRAKTAAR